MKAAKHQFIHRRLLKLKRLVMHFGSGLCKSSGCVDDEKAMLKQTHGMIKVAKVVVKAANTELMSP